MSYASANATDRLNAVLTDHLDDIATQLARIGDSLGAIVCAGTATGHIWGEHGTCTRCHFDPRHPGGLV